MLYHIVKPIIRLALLVFCRKIYINRRDYYSCKGPMILAVNHPNSFFDAVVTGVFFKQPVHFLARGDAFRKNWAYKILTSLKCIPVYRLREGKEYLHLNEDSFERCRQVLRKKGIVLIFSEGLCINEWNIRPLRKGTARLAFSAWSDPEIGRQMKVLPVGLNYNSFNRFGKKVYVRFGEFISFTDADTGLTDGANHNRFNQLLAEQLDTLCFNGVPNNHRCNQVFSFLVNNICGSRQYERLNTLSGRFTTREPEWQPLEEVASRYHCAPNKQQANTSLAIALFTALPALAGWLVSGWFYRVARHLIKKKNRELGHYDSIMFTALALFYPFYVLLLASIAGIITGKWAVFALVFAGVPVTAFFLTVFWPNWLKFWNYHHLNNEQRISLQRLTD
ncbi:MAG: 1-acyl-sn-glycerol-3-phosphate acyltransferase [Dinghuibacter sp.]|nr:1-acyl-sn-glycerol-3-phosphate acyltransferase [Dinghuibacter sp.]